MTSHCQGPLGRYMQGQSVPFFIACADATGVPSIQSIPPSVAIYDTNGALLATVGLVPGDGLRPSYAFAGRLALGGRLASGKFLVVYRYRAGIVAGLATASFEVVGGGDAAGRVIALHSLDRPEARYVLGQLSGGSLVQVRNPHF